MRKPLKLLSLFLVLNLLSMAVLPVVHAEEGEKAEKPEAKKEEGGEKSGDKSKGPSDVSGGRFAGDPIYIHLAPMVLPVISDAGVEQLVTLLIDIEVTDAEVADNIHSNMPKVMDAIMRGLYGGLGQGSLRNGKLVDVTKVKNKALISLQGVFKDGIKNVLIQGVSQRML